MACGVVRSISVILFRQEAMKNFSWLSSYQISFLEPVSEIVNLRVNMGQFVDIGNIRKKSGTLDLVAKRKNGNIDRYPFLSYKIISANSSEFDLVYPKPISLY